MLILPTCRICLKLKSVGFPFSKDSFPNRNEEWVPFSIIHSSSRLPLVTARVPSEKKCTCLAKHFSQKMPDLQPRKMSLWIPCKKTSQPNLAVQLIWIIRGLCLLKRKIHSLWQQQFRAKCSTEFARENRAINHRNVILCNL